MKRLLPRTLASRLIALLLLALVISQAVSFLFFTNERRSAIWFVSREHTLARTASTIRLLADTPDSSHEPILRAISSPRLQFWLSSEALVPKQDTTESQGYTLQLQQMVLSGRTREVRIQQADSNFRTRRLNNRPERDNRAHEHPPRQRRGDVAWLRISAQMDDEAWLNVATRQPQSRNTWAWPGILSMILMALATTTIVIIVIRRLTHPLKQLAEAAEQLGRGEAVAPVPETGPPEIAHTTAAFNRMNDRLSRFVQDRTRMLAAISHDLRTPITTLRLRTELIEDAETRAKFLESLDDMQRMAEETLAFTREEAAQEDTRIVDLSALASAICDDMEELGHEVTFTGPDKLLCRCRTVAVKRALRNLIANAVAYGARARVELAPSGDGATITIDDDGPGIPEKNLEDVFQPFMRLETSRARETGGAGLGLSISRSIIRGHGGDIILTNREGGGLRATINLPLAISA